MTSLRILRDWRPVWLAAAAFAMGSGIGGVVVINAIAPAAAHSVNIYYPYIWDEPDSSGNEIDWRFGDLGSMDTAAVRTGVRLGINAWETADPALKWNEGECRALRGQG